MLVFYKEHNSDIFIFISKVSRVTKTLAILECGTRFKINYEPEKALETFTNNLDMLGDFYTEGNNISHKVLFDVEVNDIKQLARDILDYDFTFMDEPKIELSQVHKYMQMAQIKALEHTIKYRDNEK